MVSLVVRWFVPGILTGACPTANRLYKSNLVDSAKCRSCMALWASSWRHKKHLTRCEGVDAGKSGVNVLSSPIFWRMVSSRFLNINWIPSMLQISCLLFLVKFVIAITSLWVLWLVAVSFSTKNTCLHELWELLLLTLRVRWCGILPHWSLGVVRSKMNCGLSRVWCEGFQRILVSLLDALPWLKRGNGWRMWLSFHSTRRIWIFGARFSSSLDGVGLVD